MLQRIREGSQGWVAKLIVGAIIVTFALFGAESLVGYFTAGSDDVATVNGEGISPRAVETQVQRGIRSGQVPPEQERQYRGQVIDQLIRQRVLDQYAENGGLHLSDDQLDQLIVSMPEFQDQQGRFSNEVFTNRLAQAGYSPSSFRRELRADTLRRQLQAGVAGAAFSLPSENQRLKALQQQQRTFRFATLTAADLEQPVDPQPADLERYYSSHQDEFVRPEEVKVNYLVLNQQDLTDDIDIDEQMLRDAYDAAREQAPREVSQILVTYGDERTQAEARERLEQAQSKLQSGVDFADVAREFSDDTGSAKQGGAMGSVTSQDDYGGDFVDTVLGLDVGDVSGITQSDYGLHLLKVTGIDIPTFEEDRDALARQLRQSQARAAFQQRVQRLTNDVYESDDLASVADELDLTLESSDWLSRDGGADGVLSNPDVLAAAFSPDVLEDGYNSDVIETDTQQRVVVRVTDHREASTLALDDVRDRVSRAVERQMTQTQLDELAGRWLERLRSGESVDAASWQQVEASTRDEASAPAAVVNEAFRLPRPDADVPSWGRVALEGRVALVGLESVSAGDAEDDGDFSAELATRLRAQSAIQGLDDTLQDEAEIDRR
ncbi:SurA N-terminal domain-containing protein [Salinicola aestuarinus]|uniref:SurA N-terminal domain-containing protein n=1 Tax=Salinicola aestuarinus TaxID=1949082 RepID=UPI000DA20554|nr:SurA N-terminal domain-containing protein [Salinicola aestuarinus]